MWEQEIKDFIQDEKVAGRLISADITGLNEYSLTAEAKGYKLIEDIVYEKYFYFWKESTTIMYKELIKLSI